jgi:cbb3-type cytochrome c oxidase subunit III
MRSLFALAFAACVSGTSRHSSEESAQAYDAAVVAVAPAPEKPDGVAIFGRLCAACHGADATGYKADHAPSLVNRTFLESASDDFLRRSIADGRPGTSMAAYGKERGGPLEPDAILQIVSWLRAQGPPSRAIPVAGPGDAARGAAVYASNCQKCHGTPQVRGEAVHLANARFLEAATDPFLRWAIASGRPGTPMEAWQGKLADAQIDDVVAYLRSLGAPPPAQSLPAPTGKEPILVNPKGKDPAFTLRGDPCPPNIACTMDLRYVPAVQVKQALEDKRKLVIIDARPPSDWMHVHIPGAVSIPYFDLKRLDEIPNDAWVVAYCACPHHLSGDVVDALRKRGHKNAAVLDEGILEWQRRGYPVVTAPGEKPPPLAPPVPSAR